MNVSHIPFPQYIYSHYLTTDSKDYGMHKFTLIDEPDLKKLYRITTYMKAKKWDTNLKFLFHEGFFISKHWPTNDTRKHRGREILPSKTTLNILQQI